MPERETRYMMATKAMHVTGDISREESDLCVIHDEDEENYIGNWVTGYGFIDVKFPKETTRELTEEEKDKYDGRRIQIGGYGQYRINVKDEKSTTEDSTELAIITLPEDEQRIERLRNKLEEYKKRLNQFGAPELQMDTICKIAILERILEDGEADGAKLASEMKNKYDNSFNAYAYGNAYLVIEDYCKTDGAHTIGGTGLR